MEQQGMFRSLRMHFVFILVDALDHVATFLDGHIMSFLPRFTGRMLISVGVSTHQARSGCTSLFLF